MKLSVFCGVSVDGFLARLDDTFDFLQTGKMSGLWTNWTSMAMDLTKLLLK
jgi:hypothetical protein